MKNQKIHRLVIEIKAYKYFDSNELMIVQIEIKYQIIMKLIFNRQFLIIKEDYYYSDFFFFFCNLINNEERKDPYDPDTGYYLPGRWFDEK